MKEIKRDELVEGKVYFDNKHKSTKLKFIKREGGILYFKSLTTPHTYLENQLGEVEFSDEDLVNYFYEEEVE